MEGKGLQSCRAPARGDPSGASRPPFRGPLGCSPKGTPGSEALLGPGGPPSLPLPRREALRLPLGGGRGPPVRAPGGPRARMGGALPSQGGDTNTESGAPSALEPPGGASAGREGVSATLWPPGAAGPYPEAPGRAHHPGGGGAPGTLSERGNPLPKGAGRG